MFRFTKCTYGRPVRHNGQGTVSVQIGSYAMKSKAPKREPDQQDDVRAWIVIGLIFCAVTLALYAPLIWHVTRGSL